MPLEHAKPGTPGFGRNIAEMEKSGHPPKQAIAAAYSAAGEHRGSRDAAAVRILGGEDPAGPHELIPVARTTPPTAAGSAQNVGMPSYQSLPEPYPWANEPPGIASRSVHPQPRVAIPVVGGEEVAVKDADYGGGAPEGEVPENAGMSGAVGMASSEIGGGTGDDLFGLMASVNKALESARPAAAASPPSTPPASSPPPAAEPEGGDYGGGGDTPPKTGDVGAMSIVNGRRTGYEINTDEADCGLTPVGRDSFAEVEKKAAKEYGSEEAGKRVAAAVGFAKYGKKGMERKAQAGKK